MEYKFTPLVYSIELTNKCTYNCTYCGNSLFVNDFEYLQNWKEILNSVCTKENLTKQILITGGEPTLHKDFNSIIQYLDKLGIEHALYTNGFWNEQKLQTIIELYKSCENFSFFLISIQGASAEKHSNFTNTNLNTFEIVCENIKRLTNNGFQVVISSVLTEQNCKDVDKLIDISKRLNAEIIFCRQIATETVNQNLLYNTYKRLENLIETGELRNVGNFVPPCFIKTSSKHNNYGFERCVISQNGAVRPSPHSNIVFGNLFTDNIYSIWQSEKAVNFRNCIPQDCIKCSDLYSCRGADRTFILDYKKEKDPLIKRPNLNNQTIDFELNPDFIIIPNYEIKVFRNNKLMITKDWIIPIDADNETIAMEFLKKPTLQNIFENYGEIGLDYVATLYNENMINFSTI